LQRSQLQRSQLLAQAVALPSRLFSANEMPLVRQWLQPPSPRFLRRDGVFVAGPCLPSLGHCSFESTRNHVADW
jgi:hypothetical protein